MDSVELDQVKASQYKKRLYILLLVFQLLIVFWPIFLMELMVQGRIPFNSAFFGITQTIIVLGMIITNTIFVKGLVNTKWGFYFMIVMNAGNFITSSISHLVPEIRDNHELYRNLNILSSIMVLSTLLVTFLGAVKDIFRLKHDLTYSLLGAVNIFLLIGTIFAFTILLTGSIFPGMVVPLEQLQTLDLEAMKLAFYSLASMDPPMDIVNPFIKNILMLESIFAHLFVVLIIGRLLSK